MRPHHHLQSRRERMVRSAFRSFIATPATGQVKFPAGAKVALRAVGGGGGSIAKGTTAATITGPQTRTIKTPEMAAGDLLFVDWVNKGSTVTPQANFELLVHVGLGVYKKISTGA